MNCNLNVAWYATVAAYKYANAVQSQLSESGSLTFYCLDSVLKSRFILFYQMTSNLRTKRGKSSVEKLQILWVDCIIHSSQVKLMPNVVAEGKHLAMKHASQPSVFSLSSIYKGRDIRHWCFHVTVIHHHLVRRWCWKHVRRMHS